MSQLSFFGAELGPPAVTDLSGVLAAHGTVVVRDGRARVSVTVDSPWRADAIAQLVTEAGLEPEFADTEDARTTVSTHFVAETMPLASQWMHGITKTVPYEWVPSSRAQRAWFLASGRKELDGERYVLGLDPHTPDTHAPLAEAFLRAGIAPTLIGTRGPSPGLRVSGRRRLTRLVENIGAPPDDPRAREVWPYPGPVEHHTR